MKLQSREPRILKSSRALGFTVLGFRLLGLGSGLGVQGYQVLVISGETVCAAWQLESWLAAYTGVSEN